jgi:surface polysaccharide O-acyltransferase-like enzyme
MKKLTEINLKFALYLISFFAVVLFIASYKDIVEWALKPLKNANVDYLYFSIVALICLVAILVIVRTGIEIYKNLKR